MSKYVTRKDIALALEVSVEQVRKNERRWGLGQFRQDLNLRCVRYRRTGAMGVLKKKGWVG